MIKLPESVKVEMITTENDVNKLNDLLLEKFIGIDTESRPSLVSFE